MHTQEKSYLLAIDNGTQSVRALVFDLEGNLVAKSKVEIEPYYSTQPGWAEQDLEYIWKNLCKACHQLWQEIDFPKEWIKGVSVTTQRATVVNLDKNGKPTRPAMLWLDQRQAELTPMKGPWPIIFRAIGEKPSLDYFRKEAECNWIAQNEPTVWKDTHKFLLLSGYHNYRLSGDYVDAAAAQVGFIPFDFKRFDWCKNNDWKWDAIPVKRSMLPRIVQPGGIMGHVTTHAAKETGLPEGLPIISSGADKACEVIGSGALTPEIGCLSFGTTATYNNTNSKYVEVIKNIPPYPAAIPNTYNNEIIIRRGYWMVNWFKREFGHRENKLAAEQGVVPEVLFEELLQQVPAGSMGLTLQPFWSPGVKIPGPEAKGAMIGFGDVHTRAHIYRAIIEGLAYALREGKERVERKNGVKIKTLRVSGGGSQSDQAMQITADIFNLPAERPHTFETSGLGAAINVAVGVGLYKNHRAAIANMTHKGDVFFPIRENVKIYDKLYKEVYLQMYDNLSPLYKAIQKITGYPK